MREEERIGAYCSEQLGEGWDKKRDRQKPLLTEMPMLVEWVSLSSTRVDFLLVSPPPPPSRTLQGQTT